MKMHIEADISFITRLEKHQSYKAIRFGQNCMLK